MDCPECKRKGKDIAMTDKGKDNITGGTIYECPECGYECIQRT